jgi:carboxyl-terminal processing protease
MSAVARLARVIPAIGLTMLVAEPFSKALGAEQTVLDEVRAIVAKEFYRKDKAATFLKDVEAVKPGRSISGNNVARDAMSDRIDAELASLGASHTGRYTPDLIDYYELFGIYQQVPLNRNLKDVFSEGIVTYSGIGIVPRSIDRRSFVAYVYPGTPAAEAGILPGDELISVDGKPYEQVKSFEGKAGHEVAVKLRRREGEAPTAVTLPVIDIRPNDLLLEAMKRSVQVLERGDRKIGYLRLWAVTHPQARPFLQEALSKGPLPQTDVLVVDLRSRWGGAPPDVAEMFVGRSAVLTVIDANGTADVVNPRWRKPLVALVDEGTRSGVEVLAFSMKKAGVPLIGHRTAGAVLAGKPFVLSDNSFLLLAVKDVQVDGGRLEGIGVEPDIQVDNKLPYSAGRDDQLSRAIIEAIEIISR